MFRFYTVGGCVRDELMGLKTKDIDYTVVAENELLEKTLDPDEIFYVLKNHLECLGFHMWLVTDDCFTIRAKFPIGHKNEGLTADFVLARKEVGYIEGTRKPKMVIGTLYDDLERRDFTVNAIAKDEDGNLIDPFDGQGDIRRKLLRTPLPVLTTFNDDPLRILRAIRFSITKGFTIPREMSDVIMTYKYFDRMNVVSDERIREELHKCFSYNTWQTLEHLRVYRPLGWYIFNSGTKLWIRLTSEKR